MAEMHPVNWIFDTGAGSNLIQEDFVNSELLKAIQASSRPVLEHASNEKVSVVLTTMVHVRMGYPIGREVFCFVRILALPFLLGTSYGERCVKGIFPHERKIVRYNSTLLLILVIKHMPENKRVRQNM